MACEWCGDRHGADKLCQRAQRGMTRRSFCFLFGAGIAGLSITGVDHAQSDSVLGKLTINADGSINIYRKSGGAHVYRLVGTTPAGAWTDMVPDHGESVDISGYWDGARSNS